MTARVRGFGIRWVTAAWWLLVIGCSVTITSTRSGQEQDLERNRRRWIAARVHDYDFEYQRLCFCASETTEQVRIAVRGDAVAGVTRLRDGLPAAPRYGGWPTVDDLFETVQRAIDRRPARLDVEYDPTFGYPRSIILDVELLTADDESSESASNLRLIP